MKMRSSSTRPCPSPSSPSRSNSTFFVRLNYSLVVVVSAVTIFHCGLVALGQYPYLGRCLKLPTKQNFTIRNYTGRWYVVEQYYDSFSGSNVCQYLNYSISPDIEDEYGNGSFVIRQTQVRMVGWDTDSSIATLKNQSEPAKYVVNPLDEEGDFENVPYWILATDYGNYSLVWSCSPVAAFNLQMIWFLSRTQIASKHSRDKVYMNMRKLGINTRLMTRTPQFQCPDMNAAFPVFFPMQFLYDAGLGKYTN